MSWWTGEDTADHERSDRTAAAVGFDDAVPRMHATDHLSVHSQASYLDAGKADDLSRAVVVDRDQ